MKKTIALFLCCCMALSLTACAEEPTPTQQTTVPQIETTVATIASTAPTEATTPLSTAVYTLPLACVSMPVVTETKTSNSKTISFYSYPELSLVLPDADVAEVVKLDLLNKIDATTQAAQNIHAAAEKDFTGQDNWYNYYMDVSLGVQRMDQNVLSFFGTEASYDGTPNSTTIGISANYDLATGTCLSLRSIMFADFSADVLVDLIVEGLAEYDESALLPGYIDVIDQMFSTNVPVESWYFDNNGLCFYFAPYEIAPQSMGIIYSHIPYSKLSGLMKEEYFPMEDLVYSGNVNVSALQDLKALDAYEQFGELTIGEGGNKYLLTVDGSVLNLRICELEEGNTPGTYTAGKALFAAAGMGPSNAVLLDLPYDIFSLYITYESGGERIEMPIADLSE